MIRRKQSTHLGIAQHLGHEPGRDIAGKQAVPVLAERGLVPCGIIDAETDEPAEQEVVLQPLHDLPFRADAVEGLQQQRSQKPLRRNRWPASAGIERVELAAQPLQGRIDDLADRPQRMISPHPRFEVDV